MTYPEEFSHLFEELESFDLHLLTTPSVLFEFTRGTDSVEKFNERYDYVSNLASIYPIARNLDDMEKEIVVIQQVQGKISYADFLLYLCLCKFKSKGYLMTSDHKDFSTNILTRECVITCDNGKSIHNYGIYSLSSSKYRKAYKNVLN